MIATCTVGETVKTCLVIYLLRNDPGSRRTLFDGWNVGELQDIALPPCHKQYQFFVEHATERLHGSCVQRSADAFLGLGWNIANLGLLTTLLAEQTG